MCSNNYRFSIKFSRVKLLSVFVKTFSIYCTGDNKFSGECKSFAGGVAVPNSVLGH